MRINEVVFSGGLPIDSYGPGFFRVAGTVHRGNLLLGPGGVQPWGGLDDTGALLALAGQVDVLFVGTGPDTAHLPEGLASTLTEAGLATEPMATPAACRTYNVLLSEGRRIAAALLVV